MSVSMKERTQELDGSRWAGDLETRKSMSVGITLLGENCLKA